MSQPTRRGPLDDSLDRVVIHESKAEQDARQMAEALMQKHGITGWSLGFDRAVERLGSCDHRRKRITIARLLVAYGSGDEIRDTILHEIAHALCDQFEGHGPDWCAKAIEIGALASACASRRILQCPRKWIGTCPRCGLIRLRNRRCPQYCSDCARELPDDLYPIHWKRAEAGTPEGGTR